MVYNIKDTKREIMFDTSKYDTIFVKNLMQFAPECVEINESMDKIVYKFQKTETWNLPVLDKKKYIGFVSKFALLTEYRKLLINITHD